MDSYESIYESSKHSEIFHKFTQDDVYNIPIVLYDFTLVSGN